ncbi:MAG TPA: glutamate dehydrogenase, partial [Parachlamydiaceae bacterium]|nr:glutamate dehydrogenase [Parachlamydiaceae bacterium]
VLVPEILDRLAHCAENEAKLLLLTHHETNEFLTDISHEISIRINEFTYQLLDYLNTIPWPTDQNDPLTRCFLDYCLPTLKNNFKDKMLKEIPEHHKKAIVSCNLAAHLVYTKGLAWHPTIIDVLPMLLNQQDSAS